MKTLLILLTGAAVLWATAASAQMPGTQRLEKELNALMKNGKDDPKEKQFSFNDCRCQFKAQHSDSGGFNMNMSYDFGLDEVNSISYAQNEDNTHDLIVKLKKGKDDFLDFSSFTTTLYTKDEKRVKEVVQQFRSAIKTCAAAK